MSHAHNIESLFAGINAVFLEEAYARYSNDPHSVDASWRDFFDAMGDDAANIIAGNEGASWAPKTAAIVGQVPHDEAQKKPAAKTDAATVEQAAQDSIGALMLIRAYRVRGHFAADVDPLKLDVGSGHNHDLASHPELDPAHYGFTAADMDRQIFLGGVLDKEYASLQEILDVLRRTYCSTIGTEFMHIQDPDQKAWIQHRIEKAHGNFELSKADKENILKELVEVEAFEEFLQVKYTGMKRFSGQGGDSMIPGVEQVIRTAARNGVNDVVIGMPHRGRIGVLGSVMKKPYVEIFSLFRGNLDYPEGIESSGDVKYHLGTSSDREFEGGHKVHLSLTANPSHLEAVNPVAVGKVRAKQDLMDDEARLSAMAILLHGDAAFAGQGVVAETLDLSELKGYRTGGTIHIVVNNQIGFTTAPAYSRSSPYCSDVAKSGGSPIFHVNGDDPEAVAYVSKLATEFRMQFRKDVVIDVFCYRKYGHNEGDEPMFTQPLMYKAIREKQSPATIYANRLIGEKTVTQEHVDGLFSDYKAFFEKEFVASEQFKPNKADWLAGHWEGFERPDGEHPSVDTGADEDRLKDVGLSISAHPEGVDANRKILRQLDAKREMIEQGKNIDWATAEALAFGTLLREEFDIRVSGQDSRRGTFSQRHAAIVDQTNAGRYFPLANLSDKQGAFEIIDSNLSEFAVLGFEYGYSTAAPQCLTVWEAQFGDFCNGAQVIIDQFISSAEMKWLRMSGLVMLLPHGYEGQGPEHSSARLERFLRLCAQDNLQVANCTTPANYFHILRRQLHANFRKPLILMTPKSLLRHKLCVSELKDMAAGTHFLPVIEEQDKLKSAKQIKRVVLCSGKVYYDLLEARRERGIQDVAILRLEQYYPYPDRLLREALTPYVNAELIWCQEEPENMGAWHFLDRRLEGTLRKVKMKAARPEYVGRPESASPAAGYMRIHNEEQQKLVNEALTI